MSARIPNEGILYGYTNEEWNNFSKGKRSRLRHPERNKEAQATWRSNNREYHISRQRQYQLKNNYNITEEDYNKLLIKQNYSCAICGTKTPTGKWKVFAVDHNHTTGKVRGLLCNECNRGIGLLKDSLTIISSAYSYLEKHENE